MTKLSGVLRQTVGNHCHQAPAGPRSSRVRPEPVTEASAAPRVVQDSSVGVVGGWLQMQTLRPHPRPAESRPAF